MGNFFRNQTTGVGHLKHGGRGWNGGLVGNPSKMPGTFGV